MSAPSSPSATTVHIAVTNPSVVHSTPRRSTTIRLAVILPAALKLKVNINRHAPLSSLMTALQNYLISIHMPSEFKLLVAHQHFTTAEYQGLRRGDFYVSIEMLSASKEVDMCKKVSDYFDEAPDKVHYVILEMSMSSLWQMMTHVKQTQAQQHEGRPTTNESSVWQPWTSIGTKREKTKMKQD